MASRSLVSILACLSCWAVRLPSYLVLRWIPGPWALPSSIVGTIIQIVTVVLLLSEKPKPTGKGQIKQKPRDRPRIKASVPWSLIRTGILGIPDPDHLTVTYISLGFNVFLVGSLLDFTFRAPLLYPSRDLRFSRVGYISSDSANILIREPAIPILPLELAYQPTRPSTKDVLQTISVPPLTNATDFTAAITLTGLHPETEYQYKVSNNLTGIFTTAPNAGSRQAERLSFVTSSCIKANWPYHPQRHPLAFPGFSHLSAALQQLPSPASFMLFLGDFIYVDVPLRLGTSVEHYRSEYRRVYASPSWTISPEMESLPWFHTLDDHEISNDWSSGNATAPFPAASDPFMLYHASVNPPIPEGTTPDNTTYFSFTRGPASFFMLDTRRYRTHPGPNPKATILGSKQLGDLLAFISRPEPDQVKWKMVVSSVPFTKNWQVGTSDTWGGFLKERRVVLDAMKQTEARLGIRVVILSGDRHEFAAVRYPPYEMSTSKSGPHEYCVGPLSQFYLPARSFKQEDEGDQVLAYLPDGNSKVGHIEITNGKRGGPGTSLLKYTLYIDGKVAWEHTLTSPSPEYMLSQ